MTRYRHPRVDLLRDSRGAGRLKGTRRAAPRVERLLGALGAHPSFADALLGDLAEECARRMEREGVMAARWWYLRESLRSAPHLLWNALRHGGARGRARAAAAIAGVALVPSVAWLALALRDGPPARLVVDGRGGNGGADGIVLNSTRPVRLAMRVLDADGRPLRSTGVRYQWLSGIPLRVTPSGVVTCTQPGDATVRASVGAVATTMLLRCRPVKRVRAERGINLLVGGPAHDFAFSAFGPDGRRVDELAGELRVEDSSIATLTGTRIRPVAAGWTWVTVRIGDDESGTGLGVYEPVPTLEGLRPDQLMVVAPVRLARGKPIRWQLPKGLFGLQYYGTSSAQPAPIFSVDGPVMCMPDFGPTVTHVECLVRGPGATLRMAYPGATAGEIVGSLALSRRHDPDALPPVSRPNKD